MTFKSLRTFCSRHYPSLKAHHVLSSSFQAFPSAPVFFTPRSFFSLAPKVRVPRQAVKNVYSCFHLFSPSAKDSAPATAREPAPVVTPVPIQSLPPFLDPRSPTFPLDPINLASFRPPQISRSVSQAIRLLANENEIADGAWLMNSVIASKASRPSSQKPVKSNKTVPVKRPPSGPFKLIDFGQPIPHRLVVHSFIHGLLRMGKCRIAAFHADRLLQLGFSLRTKTLEEVIAANTYDVTDIRSIPTLFTGTRATKLTKNTVPSNGSTRIAFDLLQRARSRFQHTDTMSDIVMRSCLFNGEILIAALLCIVLIKAGQQRLAISNATQKTETSDSGPVQEEVILCRRMLLPVLKYIEKNIQDDNIDPTDSPSFALSLQALANIAYLLDTRQFDMPYLSLLIKLLYSVPKTEVQVWTGHPDNPQKTYAYRYFHKILTRLVIRVSNSQTGDQMNPRHRHRKPKKKILLDIHSYNSLIHYSLRHRLSPTMANGVLRKLADEKDVRPDITTYNILLRSGTLLRHSDLADGVLSNLQRAGEEVGEFLAGSSGARKPQQQSSSHSPATCKPAKGGNKTKFAKALQSLRDDKIIVPPLPLRPPNSQSNHKGIQVDMHTLTTYIAHMTSTGQAHVVANLVWKFIPELSVIDYPPDSFELVQEGDYIRPKSSEASIRRAVTYGPFVFTVILNALAKAGKTGLAERVWILAKDAERSSWIEGFVDGVEPWCLPIHAYTIMIQCYAAEARRGLASHSFLGESTDARWKPKSNDHVVGWARFVYLGSKVARSHPNRRFAAKIMALLLHRSMMSGAQAVVNAMKALQEMKGKTVRGKSISIPKPDARYFNAALDVFGRSYKPCKRSVKGRGSHWRWLAKRSMRRYSETGEKSIHWNEMIQEIVEDMLHHGYPVPSGYHFLFVGRFGIRVRNSEKRRTLDKKPWAYPNRRERFRPHTIDVPKSRGLPVRKKEVAGRKSRAT